MGKLNSSVCKRWPIDQVFCYNNCYYYDYNDVYESKSKIPGQMLKRLDSGTVPAIPGRLATMTAPV